MSLISIQRLWEVDIFHHWMTLSLLFESNFKDSFSLVDDYKADDTFKVGQLSDFGHLFYLIPISIVVTLVIMVLEQLKSALAKKLIRKPKPVKLFRVRTNN